MDRTKRRNQEGSFAQRGDEAARMIDEIERGEDIRDNHDCGMQRFGGGAFRRDDTDAKRGLGQHLRVIGALTECDHLRCAERAHEGGFLGCLASQLNSHRGEAKDAVHLGLLAMRVGREEVNRESILEACDALCDTGHELAIEGEGAVHVADEVFELHPAAAGNVDFYHGTIIQLMPCGASGAGSR